MRAERLILPAWVRCLLALAIAAMAHAAWSAGVDEVPEYRLKAAYLYNFAVFTDWPPEIGGTLNLCLHGTDPFGAETDPLHGRKVGTRTLAVQRRVPLESLRNCQLVFIGGTSADTLRRAVDAVHGLPVVTVAEMPGSLQLGVALNMSMTQDGRIGFEVGLRAARASRLELSSRLLRLATEVRQ